MAKRNPKGSVSVHERGNMLQIRWTVNGHGKSLSMGPITTLNRLLAEQAAAQIACDIATGQYDRSLAKYKPKPIQPHHPTVHLFQLFIDQRRADGVTEQTIITHYKAMANHINVFGSDIETEREARQFIEQLRQRQNAQTVNGNLAMLKSFMDWAVEKGHVDHNPFATIKPFKVKSAPRARKPFTAEEVKLILNAAIADEATAPYHDFILGLLSLGTRPSELIGLRWRDINWNRREIQIGSSLSRSGDGRSSGKARERKATKTGTTRMVPIPNRLLAILQQRKPPTAHPNDLVFPSPRGGAIDDHSFSQRTWKRVLQRAGVPHRPPYACRHTCISHLIEQGATLPQAAQIAGHTNTRMVAQVYGHAISQPQMPDF